VYPFVLSRRFLSCFILIGASAFAAAPVVRTVPWDPADPSRPHDTFPGRSVTLKGTAPEQGRHLQATWDFGDGTQSPTFAVERSYDVSATHTYSGPVGAEYTARFTVEDTATGQSSSAEYRIAMREKTLGVEVSVAADEALWYLHKAMHADPAQVTGWKVLAFERQGRLPSGDVSDPYTDTVAQAISQLLKPGPAGAVPDAARLEALAASGTPEARTALAAFGPAAGPARRDLGRTANGDIASRLFALTAEGIGRPDARWVTAETLLRNGNSFDLDTASLLELTMALRNHVSSGKPSPIQFIQSDSQGPLDWYSAEASRGDSTDGVARTLVNRQNADGSFSDGTDATAKALLMVSHGLSNVVVNVSAQVNVTHTAWAFNRVSGKYTGNLTVANTGAQAITGPLNVGLLNLPVGVTLSNGTGTFNGAPYINFPTVTTMNPGDTATVQLQFTVTPRHRHHVQHRDLFGDVPAGGAVGRLPCQLGHDQFALLFVSQRPRWSAGVYVLHRTRHPPAQPQSGPEHRRDYRHARHGRSLKLHRQRERFGGRHSGDGQPVVHHHHRERQPCAGGDPTESLDQ
jgi:hypothetical protein